VEFPSLVFFSIPIILNPFYWGKGNCFFFFPPGELFQPVGFFHFPLSRGEISAKFDFPDNPGLLVVPIRVFRVNPGWYNPGVFPDGKFPGEIGPGL